MIPASPSNASWTRGCAAPLLCAAFTFALLGANVGLLRELADFARSSPSATHVLLMPAIALVLLFGQRTSIGTHGRPAWRIGLAAIAAGAAVMLAARDLPEAVARADRLSLSIAGIVIMWLGGFLAVYGPRAVWIARFPLLFLVLAIPMPAVMADGLTYVLKWGSAEAVSALFLLTGTTYFREGFLFALPGFSIEVADECSGIRSGLALGYTGILASRVCLTLGWTRAVLLAALLPIAIVKNAIRIVMLSLLALHVDPGYLTGQLHHEGGAVFFVVSLVMTAPLLLVLWRAEAAGQAELCLPRPPTSPATARIPQSHRSDLHASDRS